MLKHTQGELPTTNTFNNRAVRLCLFNHYLNHKVNSKNTVIENIIISFSGNYKPERYFLKSHKNFKITDDSLQDIRSVAHLTVWEATDKYLWGVSNKSKIQYKEKFDFCVFASEQVKFKLRTHLRLLNTNRICGKLPDSDSIRNIYSKLPKLKLDKNSLGKEDYESIAKEYNIKINEIKLIDKFITTKTESGDEKIKNECGEDSGNKWGQFETENSDCLKSIEDLDEEVNKNIIINRLNKIINNFLTDLPSRDKEILNSTKLRELGLNKEITLSKLGKKFNISPERVRQISEKTFTELKKILIKNKKYLEIN